MVYEPVTEEIDVVHCDEEGCHVPDNTASNVKRENIIVNYDPPHGSNDYGIGSSKAQHFIEHIRAVDKNDPEWRDKQERHAENAQLAICEELDCPVCANNCVTITEWAWDTDRLLSKGDPKDPKKYTAIHKVIHTALQAAKLLE